MDRITTDKAFRDNKLTATEKADSARHLPAKRQAALLDYILNLGEVTVAELAKRFDVSVDTIRRDLDFLDSSGKLIRTHGGAVSPKGFPKPDSEFELRMRVQAGAKSYIGKLASELVEDNTCLLINSGTSTLSMIKYLSSKKNLTVATNNLQIPDKFPVSALRDMYMFGGLVRLLSHATIGSLVLHPSSSRREIPVRFDKAFIGVGAISADSGFFTSNVAEAGVMSDMMDLASEVVILADSTKFNRQLFSLVAPLSRADYLVTDRKPEGELAKALENANVRIIC